MSEIKKNEEGQVVLTIKGILSDLDNGLTRDDIQEKYELSPSDLTRLFKHDDLKGKKTRKKPGFVLVDDTAAPVAQQESSQEEQVIPAGEPEVSTDVFATQEQGQ